MTTINVDDGRAGEVIKTQELWYVVQVSDTHYQNEFYLRELAGSGFHLTQNRELAIKYQYLYEAAAAATMATEVARDHDDMILKFCAQRYWT